MKFYRALALALPLFMGISGCAGGGVTAEKPPVVDPGGETEKDPEKDPEKGPEQDPVKDPEKDPEQDPEPEIKISSIDFHEGLCEELVNWYGRCYRRENGEVSLANASSGFEVAFTGTELRASITSAASTFPNEAAGVAYVYVFLDGETEYSFAERVALNDKEEPTEYVLAKDLDEGRHTVRVLKCTEAKYGTASLLSLQTDGEFLPPPAKPALKFELLGDSIMCGSEAMRNPVSQSDSMLSESENSLASYGYVAANYFGAQVNAITRSGALVSGYKGFASIPQYYDCYSQVDDAEWDFSLYQPDVIILDLGTNDAGLPTPDSIILETYLAFLRHIREKNPESEIFCCVGALVTTVNEIVENAVKTRNAEGDGKVYFFELPRRTVSGGHPKENDHMTNGGALYRFILETLGWEIDF